MNRPTPLPHTPLPHTPLPHTRPSLPDGLPVAFAAALLLASLAFTPALASAQTGIGIRAGTAGIGIDLGATVAGPVVLRGGVGFLPGSHEATVNDIDYTLEPPTNWLMAGADVTLLGPLRVMGGILWRSGDFEMEADVPAGTEIGGTTYPVPGTLRGAYRTRRAAPYVGVGLGRLVGSGMGGYVDLGVAFTGEPTLGLSAGGPITQVPGFQQSLDEERRQAQEDLPEYARFWPIVSIGLSFGLGG